MLTTGYPYPLGATPDADGVNFALVAPQAAAVELCLFDADGQPLPSLALPACSDGVWHGHLARGRGGEVGLVYGYRVHGPWNPSRGQRFNPAKLLLDPYAREVLGRYDGEAIHNGHDARNPMLPDTRDNAATALKARVAAPLPLSAVPAPRIAAGARVLYELHVKAMTALHPQVPEGQRGSYAGLAEPVVLDHLQALGVTTLSLMPVQQRADEARLLRMGLSNHWGYNSIAWFAPEPRYWSGRPGTSPASEFRALVDAVHARGMEVVIDVVYNHSAESDELGPTLSLRGIDNALYYQLREDRPELYENWSGCGNCLNLNQPRVLQLVLDSLRYWAGPLGVDGFRFDLAPILARRDQGERGFDPRAPFFAAVAQDPALASKLFVAEPWDIGGGGYQLGAFPAGWLEWNDRYRDTQRRYWLQPQQGGVGRGDWAQRFAASSDCFHHSQRAPSASVNFITAHDGFTLHDLLSYRERHNEANGEHNRDGHGDNHSVNCGAEGETDDAQVLARRAALQRALLSTLLLSQGTPMLLAGDEIGHSQQGNNNAYCQDNRTTWLDWSRADGALNSFVFQLLALRRQLPALQTARWWRAEDVHWLTPAGTALQDADWAWGASQALMVLWPGEAGQAPWLLLLNPGAEAQSFQLPAGRWTVKLGGEAQVEGAELTVPASGAWLLSSVA